MNHLLKFLKDVKDPNRTGPQLPTQVSFPFSPKPYIVLDGVIDFKMHLHEIFTTNRKQSRVPKSLRVHCLYKRLVQHSSVGLSGVDYLMWIFN